MHLVSVVIPTYNRARDLERALRSVLAQTHFNWEALVVDNHSTDNTDEVIRNFNDPRIKLLKIHNHGIIAASRNLGIKHGTGQYVAFLDSDDWWKPQKLELSLKTLEDGADIVYHDLFLVKNVHQKLFWRKAKTRELTIPVFSDLIENGNALNNSSVVVRKTILEQIGGMSEDPGLIAVEDFDAWLRIARITDRFKKLPHALGYYFLGTSNTSQPERILRGLDSLTRMHPIDAETWWVNYAKGRAHYKLGHRAKARRCFGDVSFRRGGIQCVLKTCWMCLALGFHNKCQTFSL